ncbi:DMT family transporter [Vibrio sp. SCSIO 43136]|uniref:DMT family transporter n=1 Tax=Vibrio sp. SCSIO 43136 TaxID=2819101 RepID=UPI002074AC04|nr:DMT family transporter [Vibrio sp. SCSIO 43136]USD67868.1 DMT family transporter [Vibrio sp. SCSIO 43136]
MNSERKGAFILVIATFLAAWGWIFSKQTIQGLPPFGFIGLRFVGASLCLLPFCYKSIRATAWSDIVRVAGIGSLLGVVLVTWVYAVSISETLGEGAFIMSLSMLIAPLVAWMMFGDKPQRVFWLSLPIAIVGLAFLSIADGWKSDPSQWWFLGNAIIIAIYFNVNAKYAKRMPIMMLTCIQLFMTGVIGLVMSAAFETPPDSVENSIWVWFALSMLLATSIRYLMQISGQKYASPTNAALLMLLEPVWTVILSIYWFDEQMTTNKFIGCALIMFALVVYRTGGRFRRRKLTMQQG